MTPFTPVYNTLGYTNQNIDPKTGLMDYNARWYNPNAGRFITEDTYEGLIHEPLSLNRYTYVYNNPLIYTDPSGHIPAVMEAAVMAEHIYGATSKDKNKDIIDGWKLIDVKGNTEGLKMGIYSRKTSDENLSMLWLIRVPLPAITFNPANPNLIQYGLSKKGLKVM